MSLRVVTQPEASSVLGTGSSSKIDRLNMSNQKEELISRKTAAVSPPIEMIGKLDDRHSAKIGPTNDSFTSADRTQISLEESEVRYRRLFETAKDGILILDGETGRIVDANPFLQDMLGYPEAN